MSKAKQLRELLKKDEPIVAPGAYDAFSAKMIEKVGFPVVYMTGFGVAGSLIGRPDIGLISLKEMANQAGNIGNSIDVPFVADADNGYGNELNVARTVELYERAGVAGIQIEDQVSPKKCGHMENKAIVPFDEAVNRIKAACRARSNPDTVIVARTDARAVVDLNEAIKRAQAFAEAGADILFVEAPQSTEEMEAIAKELKGHILMANMVENGKTPLKTKNELHALGFKFIIWPSTPMVSGLKGAEKALLSLKNEGVSIPNETIYTWGELTELSGLTNYIKMSDKLLKN